MEGLYSRKIKSMEGFQVSLFRLFVEAFMQRNREFGNWAAKLKLIPRTD